LQTPWSDGGGGNDVAGLRLPVWQSRGQEVLVLEADENDSTAVSRERS
jgi:hypothetical protein